MTNFAGQTWMPGGRKAYALAGSALAITLSIGAFRSATTGWIGGAVARSEARDAAKEARIHAQAADGYLATARAARSSQQIFRGPALFALVQKQADEAARSARDAQDWLRGTEDAIARTKIAEARTSARKAVEAARSAAWSAKLARVYSRQDR